MVVIVVSLTAAAAHGAGAGDEACPSPRRLATLLGAHGGHKVFDARCAPGRFPRPGTVISAIVGTPGRTEEQPHHRRILVVGSDARVLASAVLNEYADATGVSEQHRLRALADLDGDGIDELVIEDSTSTPMGSESALAVYRARGGKLRRVLERPFASSHVPDFIPLGEHDGPDFDPTTVLGCDGTVAIERAGGAPSPAELVIERAVRRGAKVADRYELPSCDPGRERWRLGRDGKPQLIGR